MQENLLQYICKYQKLQIRNSYTSTIEPFRILEIGVHILLADPDFFNARIVIDQQLGAGTVEIQIKSTDNRIQERLGESVFCKLSALESRAVLQLYNNYCEKHKCLQCVVRDGLLKGNA